MQFGVTERGDPGFDSTWVRKLLACNIIITKQLAVKNSVFLQAILQNKDKIILHITCTGYGGTVVEPNVPRPEEVKHAAMELIRHGFPIHQTVLRIDPIIPTPKGLARVENILQLFLDTGIKRVRVSVLDQYSHVKDRFTSAGLPLPFQQFNADYEQFQSVDTLLNVYRKHYQFEACAEPRLTSCEKIGCISPRDLEILNINYREPENFAGVKQRPDCLCLQGKTELLSTRAQCPSGCLYCYWKNA